jgi:hypothetical protein
MESLVAVKHVATRNAAHLLCLDRTMLCLNLEARAQHLHGASVCKHLLALLIGTWWARKLLQGIQCCVDQCA